MTIIGVLAQSTVHDLAAAEKWYTRFFGVEPDSRPMPGLLEWHFGESHGIQVWAEPDRAGHSSTVLDESDLDAFAAHLDEVGIAHEPVQDASSVRILQVADPDGNRIVLTGPFIGSD